MLGRKLILVALFVAGCSVSASPRSTVVRTGSGDGDTTRFYAAGDYSVAWTLQGSGCIAAIYLWGSGTPRAIAGFAQGDGLSRINGLSASDQWFLRVTSSCPWSVTLTPS